MGYIKKLKSNELVGGTDKTTIYPVTSTKAVFEEVTEGDKSSFKSQETINKEQQDELDNHDGRVTYLEDHTVKSVTINGGTKTYTVDDAGNVNLDVYTTESAEGQAALAEEVGDIRSIVGTKDSPASDTLVNRVGELESLVGGNEQGSVNQRIETAVNSLDVPTLITNYDSDQESAYNVHVEVSLEEENGKIKNLNLEAENIAPANKLSELYDYTHNLNETDVVVGAKPAAGSAQTNTIYRVPNDPSAGQYTDYMKYNNQMVPLATYDVAGDEAQVDCYTGTISGTALSVTAASNPNTSLSAYTLKNGGHFKIKVPSAATNASGGWTLSMNGLAAKTILYNGEAVTAANTWEAGEVISVYYDSAANSGSGAYYASNAQGGGANSGIKRLPATSTGRSVYYDALTTSSKITGFSYVKQPVKEGDVFKITASVYSYTSTTKARLWILANSSNEVIAMAGTRASAKDLVLVIPEGVDYVVFNNYATDVAEPEWYYAKAGSPAAYELINSSYMYGERRLLTVGENYEEGEEVRSRYGEMLKINAPVTSMNLTDTLTIGELKSYDGSTYLANKVVNIFSITGTYTSGDYAIGSCTEGTISITGESITAGTIDVTINGVTQTLDISDGNTIAEIAAMIISNFPTVEGWTLTDNTDGTISVVCNTGGINSLSFSSVPTDTNASVSYAETVGINTIRKYDGETWTTIESEEELIEDTALYSVIDEAYLIYSKSVKNILPTNILSKDNFEKMVDKFTCTSSDGYRLYIHSYDLKWYTPGSNDQRGMFYDVRKYKGMIVKITCTRYLNRVPRIAALKDTERSAGTLPSFSKKYLVSLTNDNPSAEFFIDDDTNYIFLPTRYDTSSYHGYEISVKELPTYNNIYDAIETAKLIDDKIVYDMTAIEAVASYIGTNNVWATGNGNSCFFLDVSEHQGGYLYVNNSKSSATMAFLKDDSHTTGMAPAFCEGESVKSVGTGRNIKFEIPGDANYVWFRYYINNSSSYVNPESVIAIGKGSAGGGSGSASASSLDLIYQNMQKKIIQMTNIKWTALKKISTKPSAGTHTGLPYASTQKHSKTIGEDVSIKTFMTAANNPYSLLYTEDLRNQTSEYGFVYGSPGATTFGYMGVVCSSFTGLACGIDQWTTKFMDYLARDGVFTRIKDQSAKGLKVGDWIWEDGHVRIVFEVSKVNGAISSITLAEATSSDGALTRRMTYSEASMNSDLQSKSCIIYRYNEMYKNVTYEPSEFVKAASDEPDIIPYQYNDDICTYQGDYACFRTGWPVWLNYNLKNVGTWTGIQLYKGNTLVNTYTIDTSIHKIQIPAADIATYGMYKARMTDGTNYSDYTYFEVVDVNVACERVSGNTFKISYSSSNATPVRINIGGFGGSAVCVRMLTSQEKVDGYVMINPVDWIALQLKASRSSLIGNSYYIRVFFKGEYGRVTNFLPEDDNDTANPVGLVKIDLI